MNDFWVLLPGKKAAVCYCLTEGTVQRKYKKEYRFLPPALSQRNIRGIEGERLRSCHPEPWGFQGILQKRPERKRHKPSPLSPSIGTVIIVLAAVLASHPVYI